MLLIVRDGTGKVERGCAGEFRRREE